MQHRLGARVWPMSTPRGETWGLATSNVSADTARSFSRSSSDACGCLPERGITVTAWRVHRGSHLTLSILVLVGVVDEVPAFADLIHRFLMDPGRSRTTVCLDENSLGEASDLPARCYSRIGRESSRADENSYPRTRRSRPNGHSTLHFVYLQRGISLHPATVIGLSLGASHLLLYPLEG